MFYEIFSVFIISPWLAAIPTIAFFWLYKSVKLRTALIASLLWAVYLAYELAIWFGILCDSDCNIRVDLLAIYPLLAVISVAAFIIWARMSFNRS